MSLVRVVIPHRDAETLWGDYHEWVHTTGDRARVDILGRHNPRMHFLTAERWVCNNPECPALAFVHDQAVQQLIERHQP